MDRLLMPFSCTLPLSSHRRGRAFGGVTVLGDEPDAPFFLKFGLQLLGSIAPEELL
jgi:hypothetical protein